VIQETLKKDYLKEANTEVFAGHISLPLLQNLLAASRNLHVALSSCCCSLLVSINILEHPDASFNSVQVPQSNSKTVIVPSLGSNSGSSDSSRALCFRILNNMVEVGLLIVGVQQLEDIFGIVRTKWLYWRDVDLGANDLSREILIPTLLSKTFSLLLREMYCLNAVLF
jgi:hypothetical protein